MKEEEVDHRILMIKPFWMPWKKMKASRPEFWLKCSLSTNRPSFVDTITHTINSDVYLAQLDRLHAAIQVKRPRKKNNIVFHHDNAKPYVEERVIESIEEKGWDLLPHPPYSPTEAATDYHVNRSLKNWMSNKVYEDLDELVDDVKAWIASKNPDFFARGIDMLPGKWEAVLEVDGEYAPE